MRFRRLPALALLIILASCIDREATELHAAALRHRARITKVSVGQSFADVRAILGDPESREALRTSQGDRETWRYVTDHDRSIMTELIFVDGKVVEIREVPWKGKE